MNVGSLDDVRSNIDRLYREIIKLMAERGTYVHQAAKFKTSSADVEAPKRVEQVIAKVRAFSEEAGLEPSVAEAAYRAMIAAFILVEHEAFKRHQIMTGTEATGV
jgi:isochorismate pyruvate lyase